MTGDPTAFQTLLPTSVLLFAALLIALLGWWLPWVPAGVHRVIGALGLVAAIVAALSLLRGITGQVGIGLYDYEGAVIDDRFGVYGSVLACGVGLMAMLGSSTAAERLGTRAPAYHALLLTATAGAAALVIQSEMAMLIAGLALLLPSLVGLVALEKTSDGPAEAALRQLVGAGVAVALLMYGLAVVYGATGSTDLASTRSLLPHATGVLEGLGLALILIGLAYVVGAAPLHHWVVQVARHSQGAIAGSVIALAGTAGGLTLVRVMVSGFSESLRPWVVLAAVIAAIACAYPALVSLTATSVRGLVGLGASLQGGLVIAALVGTGTGIDGKANGGVQALLFGMAAFALAVLTSFLAIALLEAAGVGSRLSDLRGLSRRSPLGATLLAVGLAGLAGLPPLAGFLTRLLVVQSAVAAGYPWLAIAAVGASAVYAVAVLRALGAIFVEDDDAPAIVSEAPRLAGLAAGACAAFGLAATVLAGPILYAANGANLSLH